MEKTLKWEDIDTEWKRNGGYNSKTGEHTTKYVCPQCGHHSLSVGNKSELYHCWSCGIKGSLKSSNPKSRTANHESRTTNLGSECPIITDYVSLPEEELNSIQDISADSTSREQILVREYLQAQGIPVEWAQAMRWGVATRSQKSENEELTRSKVCLAYRNYVEGYCCNVKYRTVNKSPTGQWEKGFDQSSAFTPCAPYNIDAVSGSRLAISGSAPNTEYRTANREPLTANRGAERLYITEGEKDACVLSGLGYRPCISVASGAQTDHQKSFAAFRGWLEPYQTVVIVGDQDMPGRQMAQHLIDYFDDREVRVVRWDQRRWGKDITEVYQQHGAEQVQEFIAGAEIIVRQDIEEYLTEEGQQETIESARGNYDHGYSMGIGPETDRHFRLTEGGGLIIVTGVPNTGKTDFLNFLTMSLLRERHCHVCYCSFETPNKFRHAGDLTQLWAGATDLSLLTPEEVRPVAECVMRHVTHIRMRRERPTPKAVLDKATSVLARHPDLQYLVIDPYLYLTMPAGRNVTETDSIRNLLTQVQDWAHDHRIWVFIVAHPRKLQKDDGTQDFEEIDMYTIAGSANWANVADFVLSLRRISLGQRVNQSTSSNPEFRIPNRSASTQSYTRLSVLKVRDQKICVPGDVYYCRQPCGRYDERATEQDAIRGLGPQDLEPWDLY